MTRAGGSAPPQAPRRFIYRSAFIVAGVFMVALAAAQFEANGAHGLRDARFVGLDIAVGLLAFRSGYVLARGYETLSRAARAQRRERK
jgi:uncharacterized membrane protein